MDEEKQAQIVKNSSSKEKLSEVKEELEIEKLKREYFIKKVNDYSNHIIPPITTKVFGLVSLAIGVSELLAPSLLPIVLASPVTPFALISVSMGFLLNKRAISIMRKILNSFDQVDQYNEEDLK